MKRVSGLQKHTQFNCCVCFSFRPQLKISTSTSGKTETHLNKVRSTKAEKVPLKVPKF